MSILAQSMCKLFVLLFSLGLVCHANAQLKFGKNPTELGIDVQFQVEGTTNADQFVVSKEGKVGIGTTTPNPSASLEVSSTVSGLLLPRMTNIQMLKIPSPAEGLLIYCNNCTPKGMRVFDGTYWTDMIGTNPASKVLYQWNFEGNNPFSNLSLEQSGKAITVEKDPLNSNNKVMKIVLLKGKDRTEVSLVNTANQLLYYYTDAAKGFKDSRNTIAESRSLGSEAWISMKIFKPKEQITNSIKPCIFQFGPVQNPPNAGSGFWQLRLRNDTSNGDTWNSRLFGGTTATPLTPAERNSESNFAVKSYGVWEHFVFHFKYKSTPDGIVEIWKDGVKYITITGQNAYAFNQNRIKWGLYLGVGSSVGQDLSCYFDDVKIGGANCSYEDISQ